MEDIGDGRQTRVKKREETEQTINKQIVIINAKRQTPGKGWGMSFAFLS